MVKLAQAQRIIILYDESRTVPLLKHCGISSKARTTLFLSLAMWSNLVFVHRLLIAIETELQNLEMVIGGREYLIESGQFEKRQHELTGAEAVIRQRLREALKKLCRVCGCPDTALEEA